MFVHWLLQTLGLVGSAWTQVSHAPAMQSAPVGQSAQLAPHASGSVIVLVQMPHVVLFGGSHCIVHWPMSQNSFVPHGMLQPLQCAVSVCGLTQVPLQLSSFGRQQMPPLLTSGSVQHLPLEHV